MYASGGQAYYSNKHLYPGATNSGDGGNGARSQNSASAGYAGGSGIVIVRHSKAAVSFTGSPTLTRVGSDFVYRFTGNGSITF